MRTRNMGFLMPYRKSLSLLTLLIAFAAVSSAGCSKAAGGSTSDPPKESFKGDPSKMTPTQRQQMQAAMSGGKPPANAPIPK